MSSPGPANPGYTPLPPTPDVSGQQPFHLNQMSSPRRRKLWPWIAAALLVLALGAGGVVAWLLRPEPAPAQRVGLTIESAHADCEDAIKARLKAPGTAKFGGRDQSTTNTATPVRVSGWVDAENSFGALVRNRYSCLATPAGERWNISDVTFSEW